MAYDKQWNIIELATCIQPPHHGTIALSYPPRVRVRATVKISAAFFNDESSITIGGYESAIAPPHHIPMAILANFSLNS